MSTETLNIDDTVKAVETGFQTFLVRVLVGQGMIKCPFLANPFLNRVAYDLANWAVGKVLHEGGMLLFFLNNRVISIDKQEDYLEAVNKVNALPDDVDDATWEDAEREASLQFKNLMVLSR